MQIFNRLASSIESKRIFLFHRSRTRTIRYNVSWCANESISNSQVLIRDRPLFIFYIYSARSVRFPSLNIMEALKLIHIITQAIHSSLDC